MSIFEAQLEKDRANFEPLTPVSFLRRAAQVAPSRTAIIHGQRRYSYAQFLERSSKLANALAAQGIGPGDCVAIMGANTPEMLEAHNGVPMLGAVLNSLNIRLDAKTIAFILDHGEAKVLLTDRAFSEAIKEALTLTERELLVIDIDDSESEGGECLGEMDYETFIAGGGDSFPAGQPVDEWQALSLLYTSGTTGNPKGVLYSHRSTLIHTYTAAMPDALNVSARDVVMPVVPMFHVNAWGLPYICSMVGAKLVFPGPAMDGKSLCDLALAESVTLSAGVPTIWAGVDAYLLDNKIKLPDLNRIIIGGSACPSSMIRSFEVNHNIEVAHAWGMTELSPLGTFNSFKAKHSELDNEAKLAFKENQGRVLFGIDMKITDEAGEDLPWDGKTFGDLLVRGPNVLTNYYKQTDPLLIEDQEQNGWFMTGDVATINPDGYMQITDRSKDVIKSGGEWISSIDIENAAVSHPEIIEAGVIAIPHPKWDERPLLVVVKKADSHITKEAILEFFVGKIAKWWIPDDVVFVDEIPHTATGKILKTKLREDFANYRAQ